MEEWRFEPAHDLGLSAEQRRLSLRREVGLESAISCFLWRSITRLYLAIAHRFCPQRLQCNDAAHGVAN